MSQFAPPERLRRVSEAKAHDIELWSEGVFLQVDTGRTLDELRHRAVVDRLALSADFLKRARTLLAAQPPMNRDSISRSYYAMYHAWRAIAYYESVGDDFQEHKKLPEFTPIGFPDHADWQNRLKQARLARNRADYRPYPKTESSWRDDAVVWCADAARLLRVTRRYLRQRGCQYL